MFASHPLDSSPSAPPQAEGRRGGRRMGVYSATHATPAGQGLAVGDHLTTSRRGYRHHGIYIGHGRVVHYPGLSGLRVPGPVQEVTLSQFARGRSIHIVKHKDAVYAPWQVAERARARLGEDCYDLLRNNCEHLCNWCISGRSTSPQVERHAGASMLTMSMATIAAGVVLPFLEALVRLRGSS
jgi:HRAS-like suppressor 3